ncbi:TetR/AcrR family transcriptional regulator [Sphingomonas tabacisoli]|uniref:TetR/AcrR family transcriptional regulator n=1 Tax=Sphingomonas tabacisoli TaxID=2249466 RepID=A0ABW4I8T9_9SPHN
MSDSASRAVEIAPRRGRPSATRSTEITDEILAVAGKMFLAVGYEATSMEAVARNAGVPKTTLYKRFSDKNELLRAVISHRMQAWAGASSGTADPLPANLGDRLAHHVATILVWATKPEVRALNRLATNLPETYGQEFSGRAFWGYRNMHALIVDAIVILGPAAGVNARNPDRVAETLMEMAAGWLVRRSSNEPISAVDAADTAQWFVDLLIGGNRSW